MSDMYERDFNHYVREHHKLPVEQIGFSLWEYLCKFGWSNESIELLAQYLLGCVEKDRIMEGGDNDVSAT